MLILTSSSAMRRTPARLLAVLALLAASSPGRAQGIVDLTSNAIPLWEPHHAITTSIKDALPVVTTLRGYDEALVRPIPDDWTFAPGYYRSVIRSYCLHAGSYGPTKGDGYLIAPLKGDRAPLIRNVILRSQAHPEVEQQYVQRLIWGIEDGAQWDSYDNEFKQHVAPLLSTQEIALLNIEPKRAEVANEVKKALGGLIPGAARKAVDAYAEMRSKITSVTDFQQLESIAVKTGAAPWGKDSRKEVQPGPWAYVGEGFFIRAFPDGYPTTTLEVYRVAPAKWTRDDKGRITRFDSGGYIIDTSYADTPGDENPTETVDGKSVRVWRFKKITFRHPDGRTYTIENRGYVVARAEGDDRSVPGGGIETGSAAADDGSLGDMGHYNDGLKKASNPTDLKGKAEWVMDHLNRTGAAFDAANNALAGGEGDDTSPKKLDPTKHTATPANTSKQRLALSAFKKG